MENINIKIKKKTREVFLSKSVIGNDGENLQEKLIFEFDEFVDGTARLELNRNNTKSYIMLVKVNNTYELPIKSIITKVGKLDMQLVITEGINENEIPIFKSNTFYVVVNSSINAVEEEPPEGYANWIEIGNAKINQMNLLMEDLEDKVESGYFNGKDALINGYNTLEIVAGNNIIIEQVGNRLIISAISSLPDNHLETSDGNVFMTNDNAYFIVKESD